MVGQHEQLQQPDRAESGARDLVGKFQKHVLPRQQPDVGPEVDELTEHAVRQRQEANDKAPVGFDRSGPRFRIPAQAGRDACVVSELGCYVLA